MADGTLSLPPFLLPWRQGGVECLLMPEDVSPEILLCHALTPEARATAREGMRGSGREAGRPHAPVQPRQSPPLQAVQPLQPVPSPDPCPPDHWPAPWRQRLAVTKAAPVLWTYWALGEDLCGTPNAARRALLQRLLGDLGHPAGTHSFWPAALPISGAQDAPMEGHSQIFWAGVHILKARALIVMGEPVLTALDLPSRLRPFQQTRHNGRLVVVLRDLDVLMEETHQYDSVREFLRQALAPFARP